MSESISSDEVERLVHSWYVWKNAIQYLEQDAKTIRDSNVRFPMGYEHILNYMQAYSQRIADYYSRQLRKRDIRILGAQTDRNEHFVMWKHRGETKMLRMLEAKLRHEVQEKMNEVVHDMK